MIWTSVWTLQQCTCPVGRFISTEIITLDVGRDGDCVLCTLWSYRVHWYIVLWLVLCISHVVFSSIPNEHRCFQCLLILCIHNLCKSLFGYPEGLLRRSPCLQNLNKVKGKNHLYVINYFLLNKKLELSVWIEKYIPQVFAKLKTK